jgi:bifunctional non-homologous end joining protein LigD
VPQLAGIPAGRVYDGELIAFGPDGLPSFPRLRDRMLAGHSEIPIRFVCFDLLDQDGQLLLGLPYRERRRRLEALRLDGPH